MASTTSPNMTLVIPGVGTQAGPQYALDINTSLTLIDQHDHSIGKGAQITPAGLNINDSLSLNDNNLTAVAGIVFQEQDVSPDTLQYLYVSPGVETPLTEDLWFNDGSGNKIQITNNGEVNATIASLPGQSYAGGTFIWKQGAGSTTPANFDIGSITIRPIVPATNLGVIISAPTGLAGEIDFVLPLLPATNSLMLIDENGDITTEEFIPNANIADNSIDGAKIQDDSLDGTKIIDHTVGLDQLETTVLQFNTQTFTITTPSFAVRAATTANGTIGTAFDNGSPLDGLTLATNDIILVKNQTVTTENGVYVVQASGTPVRHTSYDTFSELNYAGVSVTAGTANTGKNFFQNNILTSLASAQSWSTSSTQSFTVPANVNQLIATAVGGGGGGGGGSVSTSGGNGSQGAGGGNGAAPAEVIIPVTPGTTVNITVGDGGDGGTLVTNSANTNGNAGSAGATTTISTTTKTYTFTGAVGGLGGLANSAVTTAVIPDVFGASGSQTGGGGKGGGQPTGAAGTTGGTGANSNYALGGAGGTGVPGSGGITVGTGGSGGGGAGYSTGGAGANGTESTPAPAGSPGTNGSGGGGGASLTNAAGTFTSGAGGKGGFGMVILNWLGAS